MAKAARQVSLMGYLGMEPMRQMIETRLFRGPYIRFPRFLLVSQYLYETGAILGRARRGKLTILAKICRASEKEEDFIAFLQKQARERLENFGEEPDSFFDLIVKRELANLGLSLSSVSDMKKLADDKWPLKEAEPFVKFLGLEGIGFGSCFPELTEKMIRNYYEFIDMEKRSWARAHEMDIIEISFEEREQEVLTEVANYTAEYFPELIEPLDLLSYLGAK